VNSFNFIPSAGDSQPPVLISGCRIFMFASTLVWTPFAPTKFFFFFSISWQPVLSAHSSRYDHWFDHSIDWTLGIVSSTHRPQETHRFQFRLRSPQFRQFGSTLLHTVLANRICCLTAFRSFHRMVLDSNTVAKPSRLLHDLDHLASVRPR
jgi:hypothetical protein